MNIHPFKDFDSKSINDYMDINELIKIEFFSFSP